MALDVTYYAGRGSHGTQIYGGQVTRAIVSLTGSSATCGAVPGGAVLARLTAGEDCVVSNNGAAASDTNGQKILTGGTIDLSVPAGGAPFYGKTA